MIPSPSVYLRSLSSAATATTKALPTGDSSSCVTPADVDEHRLDAYTMDVVEAVRNCNVQLLRTYLQQGRCLDACNSNGESLLHLACRRCDPATVQFLVEEASVNVNVRDRMGRTVLHDTCWRPTPESNVMDVLLTAVSPELLLAVDCRGHNCWDYCRQSDWETWNEYLSSRQSLIVQRMMLSMESSQDEEQQQTISVAQL